MLLNILIPFLVVSKRNDWKHCFRTG